MIAKIPPRKKHTKSFKRLIDYIARNKKMSLGSQIIKEDKDRTVVLHQGIICEHNQFSLEFAPMLMEADARHNTKIKRPVYHCILSWPAQEQPPDDVVLDCARYALKSLNMDKHQYVLAIHRDTKQTHVHIVVNRVHPETYKAASISHDYYRLDYAMRELEIRYGFSHDKGTFEVQERQGKKEIVPARLTKKYHEKVPVTVSAKEIHTDTESLLSFVRDKPRQAWLTLLKKEHVVWQDVHELLGQYGLTLQEKGQGFAIVDRQTNIGIKASSMHETFSKNKLVKLLGCFEPAQIPIIQKITTYHPLKPVKRNNQPERESRRIERAAEREKLKQRYQTYKMQFQPAEKFNTAYYQGLYKQLLESAKFKRQRIRAEIKNRDVQQFMYSMLTLENAKEKQLIKLLKEQEKQRITSNPANQRMNYQAWVALQAEQGDTAALSQLRGFHYVEKSMIKKRLR